MVENVKRKKDQINRVTLFYYCQNYVLAAAISGLPDLNLYIICNYGLF